jgi:DNA-binding transcriptional LysR family regulator
MLTFDISQLRLLSVLYEERSVSRTAERLFLTPSAVSHALRKLRELLGDELFVRGPRGMAPTPRAHEIAKRLHIILPQLSEVLSPLEFRPKVTDRTFSLASHPYLSTVLAPVLAAAVHAQAPRARLDVRLLFANVVDDLDSGTLDVAIGHFRRIPPRMVSEELLRDSSVWVMSRRNRYAGKRLSLRTLAALPHVDVLIGGGASNALESFDVRQGLERLVVQNNLGLVDTEFAKAGLHREVRWTAPDSVAAMAIVAKTEGVSLVPEKVARMFAEPMELEILPHRTPVEPLVIQMLYHSDFADRPAVKWFLELIRETAGATEDKPH